MSTKACLIIIAVQLIYAVTAQEVAKRVPQGFVGMRGKKFTDSNEIEQFYKRKPQFFVGVKGKKNDFDYTDFEYKRAPTGFMGMRGKKEWNPDPYTDNFDYSPKRGSLIGQIDYTADDLSNRQEYPFLNEVLTEYLQKLQHSEPEQAIPSDGEEEHMTNEVDKRANIHQFFGVRGKKSIQEKRPYDLSFRGKFIGVRGKKDLKNSRVQEIKFLLDHNGPWPKRKAQMGFFGMRGKKWLDDSGSETDSMN